MKRQNKAPADSWNNVKRLINEYGKEHWKPLIVAVLFALTFSMSPYVYGYLSRIMLDDVLELGSTETDVKNTGTALVETSDPGETGKTVEEKLKLLGLMFLIYIVVHILFEALNWLYGYTITSVGQRVVFKIRQRLHDKLRRFR